MRTTEVQVRPGPARRWLFVELESADGRTGLAEATYPARHDAVAAALTDAFDALRGAELAPDGVTARLGLTAAALSTDRVTATVVSAVENALADMAAQADSLSLAASLGAAHRTRVPLYANVNRSMTEDRSPEAFSRAAAAAVADGFSIIKCAPFDEVQPHPDPDRVMERAQTGLARLLAVRAAIGPDLRLLVDCHSRFTVASALQLAAELRALDVGWYEEPLDPLTDAAGLARVAAAGLTMAGAEVAYGADTFAAVAAAAGLHVVMPDIKYCGGLREALRIAARVAERGVRVSPHSPSGPVCQLGSAHLCAALADPLPLEYAWGETSWRAALLDPPERIERGDLLLPSGPGLGARLNPTLVSQHGRVMRRS